MIYGGLQVIDGGKGREVRSTCKTCSCHSALTLNSETMKNKFALPKFRTNF